MNTINPNQKLKWIIAVVLLAVCSTSRVSAIEIIGFKIESPKNSDQNFMFAGDYAGAPGVRTNNWNNLHSLVDAATTTPITLAAGSVSNSAGNVVSGMSVVLQPCFVSGGGIFNRTAGGTNDGKMYADVADTYNCSGFSQYGYIDITNIPYSSYQIYCYFRPDNGNGSGNTRGGFWCITNTPTGTNRIYIQNQSNDVAQTQMPVPSNTGGNYVQSTTTAIGSGTVAWSTIQGGNYGVFSGLTNSSVRVWFGGLGNGTGGKDDLGNSVAGGSPAVRFKVAAFQIVQVPTGVATLLYLQSSNQTLHAGNPAGTQLTVLADLDTGATGVNETSGSTFVSDNTNVVTVNATGLMTPGTNGTAHVIAAFQTKSVTNTVSVIGPTSLAISVVTTNLLVGNGQGDTTLATFLATYSDATNVAVNAYQFVSFGSSGGVTVTSNGIITATAIGAFGITGSYDGLSTTTNNVGVVKSFTAPGSVASFAVKVTDSVSTHGMLFHDVSGAPGVRFAYWNNMPVTLFYGTVTNTFAAPFDYHGNPLSNTVIQLMPGIPSASLGTSVFNTVGTATTNESTLFDTYLDQGMGNGTTVDNTLVVSNVPYSSYDVYLYFYNDNTAGGTNRPTRVVIDGVTQYRINNPSLASQPDSTGSGYVIASPQPSGLPASIANVPWGNVVKFAGIADSTLIATWAAVGQDNILDAAIVTRARLVGFQLVKSLGPLTATNIYLSAPVPAQLPGNPLTYQLNVLADFTDGETGGNITALTGVNYSSSNTNMFSVDTNGVVTPGLTPGVATLTITYQANTRNVNVTNLAPSSVRVVATPGTVYLDGSLGLINAQAAAYANFTGNSNVNISGFNSVSFVDQASAVCSLASNGIITPNAVAGSANLGVSYLGSTNVTSNAFTVRSIADAPVLAHQYIFTNAPNSTTVIDTIGSANGTVFAALGANTPITFDGSRAIFPGTADYSTAPYINLQAGLINRMGDVTIELWGGQSQLNAWARFLGFGSTAKGLDPHNTGAETSYLQLVASYNATGHATSFTPSHGADAQAVFSLTNATEYHLVMVYAPNAGTAAFYINGNLIGGGAPVNVPLSTSVNDTVDWLGVSLANTDPPLAGWMNKLAIYEGALSGSQIAANYAAGVSVYLPPSPVATTVVPVSFNVSGGNLNLSWPADHLGWTLQVQTNGLNVGLGTNWMPVAGSAGTTNVVIPINPANGSVFYRLTYP